MNDVFKLRPGTTPLLISMPHVGTEIPADQAERYVDRADVDILPEQPLQLLSEPVRERNAARSNSHEAKPRAQPPGFGKLASHRGNQTVDFMVVAEPLLARIHLEHPRNWSNAPFEAGKGW